MPWSEITLTVPNGLKDAVSGELSELGAVGIWENGEPGPGMTSLVVYFERAADIDSIRSAVDSLFQYAGSIPPTLELASVDDRDWGEEWKKSWPSFPMGERFFVVPSWEESTCPPDRLPIRIDPGQAFGTGTHETTQLTLEAMERWMKPGQIVLDLGTGSGILAIVAALLRAKAVFGCDTDPVAVEVARENLDRNSTRVVNLFCSSIDAIGNGVVDFLACNLTADVIAEIFSEIQRAMKVGGLAVFSGILDSQSGEIRRTAEQFGHTILEETKRGEWCALVTRKNGC